MSGSEDRVQHVRPNSASWSCWSELLVLLSVVLCSHACLSWTSFLILTRFELNYSYARDLDFMDDWALKAYPSCVGPATCSATVSPVINSASLQPGKSLKIEQKPFRL